MPFENQSLVPHLTDWSRERVLSGEPLPVLDHGYLRYVAHLGDDLSPLEAARMSTGNPSGVDVAKDAATRDYLWRHAHSTPFEMAVLQIEVQVPIFVAREWHRHRTQCLAGDTRLYFDLPGSQRRTKSSQLYTVSASDFFERWHHGTPHPIRKRKPSFAERIDPQRWYSMAELSVTVERRKEDLRTLVREGKLEARREQVTNPRLPALFVQGKAWLDYAGTEFQAHVPMRQRLGRMQLRMADEATGEIRHTTVTDIWKSGAKPTFRVVFENGYVITTSKDHRFLTENGWTTLEQATGLKLAPSGSVTWRSDAPRFAANGMPAYQDKAWLAARRTERRLVTATEPRTLVVHYIAILRIEYAGVQETYDLEVAGPYHNFVADGLVVHNSYNEFSGRYAQMPALYYQPAEDRVQGQSTVNKQGSSQELAPEVVAGYRESIATDQELVRAHYEQYLEAGIARELARINLPLSQYTRFRAQANLRNWLHFLDLRMAPNAQYEIRVYAHTLARVVEMLWPETWAVFKEHTLDGATLSRSERQVLHDLLRDALGVSEERLGVALLDKIGSTLNPSRARELLAKLGMS